MNEDLATRVVILSELASCLFEDVMWQACSHTRVAGVLFNVGTAVVMRGQHKGEQKLVQAVLVVSQLFFFSNRPAFLFTDVFTQ